MKNISPEDEADIQLLLDQYRETRRISFPSNLGISGQVLKTREIVVSNNLHKAKTFQQDVDNQTSQKDIKNFMIGPVFGHIKDNLSREQIDLNYAGMEDLRSERSDEDRKRALFTEIDRLKPLGVVQFINKKNFQ